MSIKTKPTRLSLGEAFYDGVRFDVETGSGDKYAFVSLVTNWPGAGVALSKADLLRLSEACQEAAEILR
jgi:hypothetical protein